MNVRLVEKSGDRSIPVSEMKDGDVGIITEWVYPSAAGTIIQRYDKVLIALGRYSGCCWPNILSSDSKSCRVRVLEKGETLVIE